MGDFDHNALVSKLKSMRKVMQQGNTQTETSPTTENRILPDYMKDIDGESWNMFKF